MYTDVGSTRQKIMTAQFECYQKIMMDNSNVKGTVTKKKDTLTAESGTVVYNCYNRSDNWT